MTNPAPFDHSTAYKDATKSAPATAQLWAKIKDLFEQCPKGMSFVLTLDDDSSAPYLRALISKKAKAYGRQYSVIDHGNHQFEIAHVDPDSEVMPIPVTEASYYQSSPKALEFQALNSVGLWESMKGLFENCPAGKSFSYQLPVGKTDNHLRSLVSKKAKLYNRKMVVIKHTENNYEIARLAIHDKPAIVPWSQ